jgi:Holliday junction resolvase
MAEELKKRINAKKKGNIWENNFANWLKDNGIKAFKDTMSGGGNREKGDISNDLNLHIEVKGVKKINLLKVWKKAIMECEKTHNNPLIAIHFDGMPNDRFLVVIDNYSWLELLKKPVDEKVVAEYKEENRNQKYVIENAILALKRLLKTYEA